MPCSVPARVSEPRARRRFACSGPSSSSSWSPSTRNFPESGPSMSHRPSAFEVPSGPRRASVSSAMAFPWSRRAWSAPSPRRRPDRLTPARSRSKRPSIVSAGPSSVTAPRALPTRIRRSVWMAGETGASSSTRSSTRPLGMFAATCTSGESPRKSSAARPWYAVRPFIPVASGKERTPSRTLSAEERFPRAKPRRLESWSASSPSRKTKPGGIRIDTRAAPTPPSVMSASLPTSSSTNGSAVVSMVIGPLPP